MKLFGLYFERADRMHRRRANDPECHPATAVDGTRCTGLRIFATVALTIAWLNVFRFASAFTASDIFGAKLMMKMALLAWFVLTAIMHTAYYVASDSGKLRGVLVTVPVTPDCIRGARRIAVVLTVMSWISIFTDASAGGVFLFFSNSYEGELDFLFAPFFTRIDVSANLVEVVRAVGYAGCMFILASVFLCHSASMVLVYIFYCEYKNLNENIRSSLAESGQFHGDVASFRRRHQVLSSAVGKVDEFMRLSNVAGLFLLAVGRSPITRQPRAKAFIGSTA